MKVIIIFVIFSLLAGIAAGLYYLMNKKQRSQIWNKKTKVLVLFSFGTLCILFLVAAILSSISLKLF